VVPQYTANKEAPLNPSDFKNSFRLILFSIRVYFLGYLQNYIINGLFQMRIVIPINNIYKLV